MKLYLLLWNLYRVNNKKYFNNNIYKYNNILKVYINVYFFLDYILPGNTFQNLKIIIVITVIV